MADKIFHSSPVTFIDRTDDRKLDVYISSNHPTVQLHNANTNTNEYTPDWSVTKLELKASFYVDSTPITPTKIEWSSIIGTTTTVLGANSDLYVSTNVLKDNPIITYRCRIEYQNLKAFKDITFARTDTGKNGTNGSPAPAVQAQYSVDGVSGWTPTLNAATHKYIKYSYDGGKTWTTAIKMVGEDGTSVRIKGTATSATSVTGTDYYTLVYSGSSITGAELGDAYLYNGDLYVCASSRDGADYFINVGAIQGPAGNDGISSYVFIRYATDANGTGMSTNPSGKTYMGVYTSNTNVAPTTASSYTWSKFVGDSAKSIVLSGDSQVFKVSTSNVYTPATIKVTAQAFNTSVTTWTYSTNGGQTFVASAPTGVSLNGNVVTITGSTLTTNSVVIKASDGSVEDVFTVYKAFDGTNGNPGTPGAPASMAFLTNENVTIAANANGDIATTSFSTNVVAYKGATKETPTIGTISGLPIGMSFSIGSAVNSEIPITFTITNNSTVGYTATNNGSITIPVNGPSVYTNLILTWSKVNAGPQGQQGKPGIDAYTVLLTNESHVFAGDVNNALASSAETQVLAYRGTTQQKVKILEVNGQTAAISDTAVNDVSGLTFRCDTVSEANSPKITFTCTTAFKGKTNGGGTIPVKLSVGGVEITKMFTYSIAFKGATGGTGSQGPQGTAATSYWLVSSASAVQKTSTGTITVTPSTLTFTSKSKTGTNAPVDYACRWIIDYSTNGTSYTNLYTSTANEASKTVTVATTYKTIRARMYMAGGTTALLDEQIIPVVSDGATGPKGVGVKSTTVAYGVSDSASTRPADNAWQSTIPTVSEGKYLWTRTIIDYTDDAIADTVTYTYAKQGATGATGQTGSPGTSVTVKSIKYQSGTSATTAPTGTWSDSVVSVAEGNYLWTQTTFSDNKVAYGVAKQGAKGSAGVNAITFQIYAPNGYLLSNELESLTLQTFAYDGSTAINSATYAWSYQENDAWVAISNATTSSLTLTKDDVIKSKTYRCAMTYKNTTYYSTATVQDKSDIYDVMICVSDNINPLTGIYYWVVYALLYSEQGEADALLGPISIDAPASPVSGDYWYAVDATTQTVTLKKYNGSTWVASTDKQAYAYDWRQIVDGTQQQAIGNTDKVQIISCNSFTSSATFQCIVTDTDGSKLARCNIHLTDTSDPIVSTTAPVGVKDGQLWMQTQTDGTFLLYIWDADTNTWKQLNADTKNVVHTTKPSSYKSGDLWVVESDSVISGYTKGTLLQANATTTTFNAAHWSPSLKYEAELSDVQNALKAYRQYMSVDSDGLHMQAKNSDGTLSPFQALFTNTRLSFYQDDLEVAYIGDNKLNIYEANIDVLSVEKKIQLQKFEWAIESNGSMSLIVNY
jgi:hypothetical protein